MQPMFKYFALVALALCGSVQPSVARGYVSSQNQSPAAVVVEEIQMVENTAEPTSSSGIWDKTKEMGNDVWDGTKEVTSDVWDGTKKVSGDVWDGAKEVGGDIKDAVSPDSHK